MIVPPLMRLLPLIVAMYAGLTGMAVSAERRSELVRYDNVQIEVVVEGEGPAVVLLPSLARDSDDYDEVAEGLTAAGFRVLRPKPRGIGRSSGPMTNISLHDFARDIAAPIIPRYMATTTGSERANGGTIMLPQKRGWPDPACVSMLIVAETMMHARCRECQCASPYRSAL